MRIEMTDAFELSRQEYTPVEEGWIYHAPGRLVVFDRSGALLIELDQYNKVDTEDHLQACQE